jgi:hypothetical protein
VARFWAAHLVRVTGVRDAQAFAIDILGRPDLAAAFKRYEAGYSRPQFRKDDPLAGSNLGLAEAKVPGSSHYLLSPMWEIIHHRDVPAEKIAQWNSRLTEAKACISSQSDEWEITLRAEHERELSFHHLEAIISLLREARSSGDCASTEEIIRVFGLLRPSFLKSAFATGFEHTLLPLVSDWVGETVTESGESPGAIADCDTSASQTAETRTGRLKPEALSAPQRVLLGVIAIVLTAILVWADNAPASQVALLMIATLGCLVALSTRSHYEKLPAYDH